MNLRRWIGSIVLLVLVAGVGGCLAAWKYASIQESAAAAANQPEPMESVTVATAAAHEHREVTTSIGTVLALQSINLRNEVPGTIDQIVLSPGQIVDEGTLLVALDVSVEQAELHAQEAQAALAETLLARVERANQGHAVSEIEVDRARAERDVARAQIARLQAIIDRKTIRAPFRARVGMADVHRGQYLEAGTLLTTLQGVDEAVHVDFSVAQWVAADVREGDSIEILTTNGETSAIEAKIIAVDARIDPHTRNAIVRARIDGADAPAPGAAVRVRVPVGESRPGVVIPVSALRKGPEGDHVFVIESDSSSASAAPQQGRAHVRKVVSGTMLGDLIVIHQGLSAGEQVAASGSFKLREGVLVVIAPPLPPPAASPTTPATPALAAITH